MIAPEEAAYDSATPLSADDVRDAVLHGYIETAHSADVDDEIAERAWSQLSSAERDLRSAIAQKLFPDDIDGRERAWKVMMLADSALGEIALTATLEEQLKASGNAA